MPFCIGTASQLAEKQNRTALKQAHGFSRANKPRRMNRALAPVNPSIPRLSEMGRNSAEAES
jgi:hypothetical protein